MKTVMRVKRKKPYTLKGVNYLYDAQGNPVSVQMDLQVWEDIYDRMLAAERRHERSYSSDEVKSYLRKRGKLS